jgi:predicted RNase H-like HicB family nuclease
MSGWAYFNIINIIAIIFDYAMIDIMKYQLKLKQFPVLVEKGEDGFYVVECPIFEGCYSQGKTLDKALENIKEVISLCLEEEKNQELIADYQPQEMSFHTISI